MEILRNADFIVLATLALYILLNIVMIIGYIRITDRNWELSIKQRLGYILAFTVIMGVLKVGLIGLYVTFR